MITFMSWREALVTNDEEHYYRAVERLRDAGVDFRVKVKSMNRGGSRRCSAAGTAARYMYSYQIYVKKPQLEQARYACRGGR